MAGMSVAGLGSGLDVQGIVSQLMSIERQPLTRLQTQQQEFKSQLSAYGQLKGALSSFEDAMGNLGSLSKFEVYKGSSSNEDVLTVTTDENASRGSYQVRVVELATAQKLRTGGYSSAQDGFGLGSLDITVGGSAFSVAIDATNNTLSGIRDAINNSADNTGVTASIVSDGTNSYLTLTSDDTGAANTISVVATDDGSGVSSLTDLNTANLTELQVAKDARLYIDGNPPALGGNGIEVTSASNTVEGVIEGVTLNLKTVSADFLDVAVARDVEAVKESVQGFVDTYNKLRSTLSSLRSGTLEGDSTLLSIESSLRSVLNTAPSGLTTTLTHLSQVGIKTERDGSLSLNATELETALNSDFAGVAELFAHDDQGYAFRLEATATDLLDLEGVISAREEGLNSRIDSFDDQISRMEYRLELIQGRYQSQFGALDSLLSQMQSTSAYLTQQLSSLGG